MHPEKRFIPSALCQPLEQQFPFPEHESQDQPLDDDHENAGYDAAADQEVPCHTGTQDLQPAPKSRADEKSALSVRKHGDMRHVSEKRDFITMLVRGKIPLRPL